MRREIQLGLDVLEEFKQGLSPLVAHKNALDLIVYRMGTLHEIIDRFIEEVGSQNDPRGMLQELSTLAFNSIMADLIALRDHEIDPNTILSRGGFEPLRTDGAAPFPIAIRSAVDDRMLPPNPVHHVTKNSSKVSRATISG